MIKWIIAIWVLIAGPLSALPVEVTSGEHDGFTRLVLNFGTPVVWSVGRTSDGYRFRPESIAAEYALEPVFNRIGKSRLAAISANRETSELDIGFACACHAIPFEFRPGIIVIDLRDGAPPKGSSFETPLPDISPPTDRAQPTSKSDSASQKVGDASAEATGGPEVSYNWIDRFSPSTPNNRGGEKPSLAPLPTSQPDLQPLRDQLLRQLSRGASQGVIDLALAKESGPIAPRAPLDAARVALGEMGGITTKTARAPQEALGQEGDVCIPSDRLAIANWAEPATAGEILSRDFTALVKEFDTPDPDLVEKAAQARIYLGFGQEARQVLRAFSSKSQDTPLLQSLSYLVDLESDPDRLFAGQGRCTTAAALWASLSDPEITHLSQVDTKAVVLAFAALPSHLRRHLAPALIDKFIDLNDNVTATTLRNAALRAMGDDSADLSVAAAKIDLAKGDAHAAEAHLEGAESGATLASAKALMTRVDARIAQGIKVDPQTVSALAALQKEMADTEIGPDLEKTMIRAHAAAAEFEAAFAGLENMPSETAVVWQSLAKLADDTTFLTFATSQKPAEEAYLPMEISSAIAARFLGLGLPEPALQWASYAGISKGLLPAQIHLALRDGQSALAALDGEAGDLILPLRAQALSLLGRYESAAQTLAAGPSDAQAKALLRAKDWAALSKSAGSEWATLASTLAGQEAPTTPMPDTFGPLARSTDVAAKSAATRAEIKELLQAKSAD